MNDLIRIVTETLINAYGECCVDGDTYNQCIYVTDEETADEYKISFERMT